MAGGRSASRWTESRSAPALAKASTYRPGFSTIRWASRKRSVCFRMEATTGTPMVMLGTNMPSITSTWSQSAAGAIRRISRSRSQKSAERMEGAIFTIIPHSLWKYWSGRAGTAPAGGRGPGTLPLRTA